MAFGSGVVVGTLTAQLTVDKKGFDEGVSGAKSGFAGLGSAATLGMAVVGAAIVGAGIAAFKMGETYTTAFNKLSVGAGDSTDEIKAAFDSVSKEVPQDLDTVAETMDTLGDKMGSLTTDELADLTKSTLDFARVTGEDAVTTAENLADAYNNWGTATADQVTIQDELLRASEESGVGVNTMLENLTKFGPTFRDMGLSMDESIALLATFGASGVPVETAMKGMQTAMVRFSADGLTMQEGLQGTIDKIVAMGPGADATALAVATFGSKAGPQLRDAILEGKVSIDEMMQAVQDGGITVEGEGEKILTLGDRVNEGMNGVTVAVGGMMAGLTPALGPLVDQAFGLIVAAIDVLMENIPAVAGVLAVLGIAVMATVVPPFLAWAAATLAATWPLIAIAAAVGIVIAILDKLGILDDIIHLFEQLAHVVMDVVGGAFHFIADLFNQIASAVLPILRGAFEALQRVVGVVADFVKSVFSAAMNGIKAAIDAVSGPLRALGDVVFGALKTAADLLQKAIGVAFDLIKSAITTAAGVIKGVIDGIRGVFDGLLSAARSIFASIKGVFDTLWNGIVSGGRQLMTFLGDLFKPLSDSITKAINIAKDIWNGFVRFWNGFEIRIPSISVGDFQVTPALVFGLPDLPGLARGGFVPASTFAVVGEEGPEIVRLPGGSNVYSNEQSRAMMGGGSGIGTMNVYGLSPEEVEVQTLRAFRRMALEWSV